MKYCSECGVLLKETDKYCSNCGAQIKNVENGTENTVNGVPDFSANLEKILKKCPCILQVIKNFSVDTRDGSKTTIEYTALTNRGIFIFNLVNAIGNIQENPKSSYWECNGIEIANPIKQSEKDLESIKSFFIKRKYTSVFAYVVFPDDADLTNVSVGNAIRISKLSNLRQTIENDIQNYGIIYSREDLLQVSKMFSPDSYDPNGAVKTNKNREYLRPKSGHKKLLLGIISIIIAAFIFLKFFDYNTGNLIVEAGDLIEVMSLILAFDIFFTGIFIVIKHNAINMIPFVICLIILVLSCACVIYITRSESIHLAFITEIKQAVENLFHYVTKNSYLSVK